MKQKKYKDLMTSGRVYGHPKNSSWSQITPQEREFYLGYQPKSKHRASVLMGDRILIGKYTGNQLHNIPVEHLKELINTYQISNPDDKSFIKKHLLDRQQ